jgi:hypothetical protein
MPLDDLDEPARLAKERDAWKKAARDAEFALEASQRRLRLSDALATAQITAPKWAKPAKKKARRATALVLLSDLHLDEVVKPDEMLDLNAYNRDIALKRLKKVTQAVPTVARDHLSGFDYDGCVLLLGGDIFTGIIHEELKETNAAPILASLEYWLDPMAAAIQLLRDEFEKLLVVSVVGNHGRMSQKWRYKGAVEDNFDWFLARQLARHFAGDKRISWHIPLALDAYFDVYGFRHLLTHGNQARGGSGIAGLMTPLALFDHRKRRRDASTIGAATHTWLGHWHQLLLLNGMTVNGSLKGYDEYAFGSNFPYEDPQQAFAVITPEHNVTIQTALYALDRKAERW